MLLKYGGNIFPIFISLLNNFLLQRQSPHKAKFQLSGHWEGFVESHAIGGIIHSEPQELPPSVVLARIQGLTADQPISFMQETPML